MIDRERQEKRRLQGHQVFQHVATIVISQVEQQLKAILPHMYTSLNYQCLQLLQPRGQHITKEHHLTSNQLVFK